MVSYGRRKRSPKSLATVIAEVTSPRPLGPGQDDEVVVVGTIKITDAFNFRDGLEIPTELRKLAAKKASNKKDMSEYYEDRTFLERNSACTDLVGLIIACLIFLFAQLVCD